MGFCFDFQGKVFGPVDNGAPLFCIAGPCALESRAHALEVASALREIFAAAGVSFIYKSSFDKANRSSGASFRGVGMAEGLVHKAPCDGPNMLALRDLPPLLEQFRAFDRLAKETRA